MVREAVAPVGDHRNRGRQAVVEPPDVLAVVRHGDHGAARPGPSEPSALAAERAASSSPEPVPAGRDGSPTGVQPASPPIARPASERVRRCRSARLDRRMRGWTRPENEAGHIVVSAGQPRSVRRSAGARPRVCVPPRIKTPKSPEFLTALTIWSSGQRASESGEPAAHPYDVAAMTWRVAPFGTWRLRRATIRDLVPPRAAPADPSGQW